MKKADDMVTVTLRADQLLRSVVVTGLLNGGGGIYDSLWWIGSAALEIEPPAGLSMRGWCKKMAVSDCINYNEIQKEVEAEFLESPESAEIRETEEAIEALQMKLHALRAKQAI